MNSGISILKATVLSLIIFSGFISCNDSTHNKKDETKITPAIVTYSPEADSLRQLITENPDSAIYRQQLILQLQADNMIEEALKQNDTLLQQIGDKAVIWMNRASLLEDKGDTTNAINAYEKAIALQSTFPEAKIRLAKLYAETKNPKALQLVDNMSRSGEAFGFEQDIVMIRGVYFQNIREYEKALACFDQCINDNYTFLEAYVYKGQLLYNLKRYKESIAVFDRATTVKNSFADGYFWLAKNEEALQKTKEAIDNYKRALALDQNYDEARDALKRLGVIK